MFRKQSEIQQTNLKDRSGGLIGVSCLQAVKVSAKIAQGAFDPIMLINDLHFKIKDGPVI